MQLIVRDLAIDRGGRRIVDRLSFTVSSGEALVLTGPNGAGKTTLIRAIAGFLPAAEGEARLEGGAPDTEIAEQSHLVGHRDGIKGALTVAENAGFFQRYLCAGAPSAAAGDVVRDALERLGLGGLADVPAAWLSAGQRRRLGLSRLLLAERRLWLLDEPTVSLDASAVETLARMVGEHVARGGLVVAATHIPLGLSNARELRMGGV
jgi:heme exporter protein A